MDTELRYTHNHFYELSIRQLKQHLGDASGPGYSGLH